MKKAILIIICSILILPNLKTETIWAVDISICSTPDELTPTHQSGDFQYFESDGAIAITAYTGTGGDVVIPSAIDGKPVVSIWYLSFPNLSSLTSVTIPNSVTCIGDAVFAGLYGLTSIVVDTSNTVYSSQDGVLYNKAKTVLIQYPGGKPGGFTILETVTSIGDWAFLNCHALTSVTIPDSVKNIGQYAFSGCSGFTSVTIPKSVTSIGDAAFYDCQRLTSIVVDASNTVYSSQDGVLYNKAKTVLIQYPGGKSGVFTIPDSVTSIGDAAFAGCDGLTRVTIGNSVTSIGDLAFQNCTGLKRVIIGNSVTSIGDDAFRNCTALTSVRIPDSVTSIGHGAFYDCHRLTSIVVDASNTAYSSQDGVLYNKTKTVLIQCPGGKSGGFTIPDSVTSIVEYAFESCTSLTKITIPDSVTIIGDWAFHYCTGLTSVTIGNSVASIGRYAFSGCSGLTRAYFYGNAPSMGEYVFNNCSSHFTVCYTSEATGFTTPTWNGYPAKVCENNQCAAEAIYGENAEETELLRYYRDNVLSKTPEGQEIIKTYYKYSPTITELLEHRPLLKDNARMIIDNMLPGIRKKVQVRSK